MGKSNSQKKEQLVSKSSPICGLVPNLATLAWGKEKAIGLMRQAGFTDVCVAKEMGAEVLMIGKKL